MLIRTPRICKRRKSNRMSAKYIDYSCPLLARKGTAAIQRQPLPSLQPIRKSRSSSTALDTLPVLFRHDLQWRSRSMSDYDHWRPPQKGNRDHPEKRRFEPRTDRIKHISLYTGSRVITTTSIQGPHQNTHSELESSTMPETRPHHSHTHNPKQMKHEGHIAWPSKSPSSRTIASLSFTSIQRAIP